MPRELKERLREYSLRVIKMYCALPKEDVAKVLGGQVLRSGTSPGAQHAEASRSRSNKEFISKMESALQELEETAYWLDLLVGSNLVTAPRMEPLQQETNELISIFVASIKTAKTHRKNQ